MTEEVTDAMHYADSLRYMKEAPTDEQRQHVLQSQLYLHGDAWLVWVNEGDLHNLAMRAASNSPTTNGEVTETLRTAIIQTLMACTDKMGFDLAGNDFAYVANELLNGPIANLTPRAPSDDEAGRLRELLQTTRDYVADAALGALTYKDSGEGFIFMAKEDLARIDAALTARELRQSNTAPTPRPPRKSKSTTADDLTEQGEK